MATWAWQGECFKSIVTSSSRLVVIIFKLSPRKGGREALESTWNIQPHYIYILMGGSEVFLKAIRSTNIMHIYIQYMDVSCKKQPILFCIFSLGNYLLKVYPFKLQRFSFEYSWNTSTSPFPKLQRGFDKPSLSMYLYLL